MPKWYSFLEDNGGGFSMMRVCLLVVVLTVMINWSWINYKKSSLEAIPDNCVALISALAGAKVIQRFGEKSSEVSIDPTTNQPTFVNAQGQPVQASTGGMTVTVQGNVPVQGTIPVQQYQQPTPAPSPAPVPPPMPPMPPTQ